MRLYLIFLVFTALFITGCYVRLSRAGERDFTRPAQSQSFFDRDGRFRGSSIDTKSGSSFYDRNGSFSGTAIKNSNGTTSFYDKSGRFTGSSTNATQSR